MQAATDSTPSLNQTVVIDHIYLHGNKKTKDRIILRELSIQEGLAISHEDFQGKFIIGELRGPKDLNHFKFAADHSHGSPIKE